MSSSVEFETAARQAVEEAQADVRAAVAEMGEPGAESEARPELPIDSDLADEAARLCFAPLAKYDHPAWELNDTEAAKLAPRFEKFFHAVADRYLPGAMLRMAAKHPELFNLSVVLMLMYWKKYRLVAKAKEAQEAEPPQFPAVVRPIRVPNPDAYMEAEAAGEKVEYRDTAHCEVCGGDFPSLAVLTAHLPCKKNVQ